MKTAYASLKNHFDTMIIGGRRRFRPDGFESLRDTYEIGFGVKIPLFDIYRERIGSDTNPIMFIATLAGPESKLDDIPFGIMVDGDNIVYSHAINESYLSKIKDSDIESYINEIYFTVDSILRNDKFYLSDKDARSNMLVAVTRSLPFYITFFHVIDIIRNNLISGDPTKIGDIASKAFNAILEKYIIGDEEDRVSLLSHLLDNNTKYSDDISIIYRQMTFNNTIELFV